MFEIASVPRADQKKKKKNHTPINPVNYLKF